MLVWNDFLSSLQVRQHLLGPVCPWKRVLARADHATLFLRFCVDNVADNTLHPLNAVFVDNASG